MRGYPTFEHNYPFSLRGHLYRTVVSSRNHVLLCPPLLLPVVDPRGSLTKRETIDCAEH